MGGGPEDGEGGEEAGAEENTDPFLSGFFGVTIEVLLVVHILIEFFTKFVEVGVEVVFKLGEEDGGVSFKFQVFSF